jgi:transporter family-2 protein
MSDWLFIPIVVAAGALIAFQAPINGALARNVGVQEAALVSFAVGTLAVGTVALVFGRGSFAALARAPWWQWLGGLAGGTYVTLVIVALPRVGVTALMVAGLAGQLTTGLLIDHMGWFGVPVRPVEWPRIGAVVLLAGAIGLLQMRR